MWVIAFAVVIGMAGVTLWIGARRWQAESARVVATLRSHARRGAAPFHAADLAGLPAPVVRYLRHVLQDGQPMITAATIVWEGEFNMGQPGRDNWRPFTATQEFVPGAPGFVWNARIAMLPWVPVFVRDSFVEGRGSMRGAVWGLIPVVTAEGTPTLASGALQRYLGEAAWFPTALLARSGVTWTAIDDTHARATLSAGARPCRSSSDSMNRVETSRSLRRTGSMTMASSRRWHARGKRAARPSASTTGRSWPPRRLPSGNCQKARSPTGAVGRSP